MRLWLNGALLETNDLHLHSLIDRVQKEHEVQRLISSLTAAPLSEISSLRAHLAQGLFHSRQRIDMREGSPAVHFSSDQAKEPRYNSKSEFNVGKSRKNLYSAVFVVDPSVPGAVVGTAVEMQRIADMGSNVRTGLAFARPEPGSEGERFMQGFLLLKRAGGSKAAFEFLHAASDVLRRKAMEEFSWETCERAFKDAHLFHTDPRRRQRGMGDAKWAVDAINGVNAWAREGLSTDMEAASMFISERGLQHGDFLSNGVVLRGALKDGRGWSSVRIEAMLHEDYDLFRDGLANGSFQDDESSVPDFIFRAASPKFSPHLIPGGGIAGGVPALSRPGDGVWEAVHATGYVFSSREAVPEVTMWVFFNENSPEGLALLKASVEFALSGSNSLAHIRIALLPTGESEGALASTLRILPSIDLGEESRGQFIARVINEVGTEPILCGEDLHCRRKTLQGSPLMSVAGDFGIAETLSKRLVEADRPDRGVSNPSQTFKDFLTSKSPKFTGSNAIIVNGWAVSSSPNVVAGDIASLVAHATHALAGAQIAELTRQEHLRQGFRNEVVQPSDRALLLASALTEAACAVAPMDHEWKHVHEVLANCRHTCSRSPVVEGENSLVTVLNPIAPEVPRLSSLLGALSEFFDVGVTLLMNPPDRVKQPPLQSFYRYVLPKLGNALTSGHLPPPVAHFNDLRGPHMVSLHMDVPEAWELLPTEANMDLYNMKLSDMQVVKSVFMLQFLVLTGNIWAIPRGDDRQQGEEALDEYHPAGVNLEVRERRAGGTTKVQKVIAMGNRGYFQVKVLPGAYLVSFSPGCTRSLYSLHVPGQGDRSSLEGFEAAANSLPFAAATLSGLNLQISGAPISNFRNVTECESASEAPLPSPVRSWLMRSMGRFLPGRASHHETVHIFSLASGHMYERLLRIMILSVTNNTRRPVKFWFLKSYASPEFAALLGAMAKEYKFDYDFVSYKWPAWLFRQGDQQRLMWAYKILFLDVLFPPEVQRITFVDADQVMRADVAELHDMDLQGAPYAYTPFCNDYEPMEGFRFWRKGFWAEHLAGKPYHISALYVVDLVRFRRTGAGDKLRNLYNKLAPDGKSLSNLDQDLPNYAQFVVPIFSLPQDWLYCETWCGPTAIETAKAIELCNNPATRESKLDGARRIIGEWTTLDDEQRAFSNAHLQEAGQPQDPRSEL